MKIDNYNIVEEIGRGGMGIVYKGKHTTKNIPSVAIKSLYSSLNIDAEIRARFRREATLQRSLNHQNLIKLIEYIEENNSSYIIMEYFKSRTLEKMIGREVGPIPYERVLPIFTQILDGVSYAHKNGIIHRDIKPSNILIGKDDLVRITDFGIAKLVGDKKFTKDGTIIGTGPYMSPEQITGDMHKLGNTTDIYSLGITLYEMLAGCLPFPSKDLHEMQKSICNDIPLKPTEHYPHIPDYIVNAVLKAIEKNSTNRFQTCDSFKSALLNSNIKINVIHDSLAISIGRASDNNIVLNDSQISRYHARIEVCDNVMTLIDDKSINGTYVNGEKIISTRKITGNEKIQLGKISLDWKLIKTLLEKPVIEQKPLMEKEELSFEKSSDPKSIVNVNKSPKNKKGTWFLVWGILVIATWIFRQIAWQGGDPWDHNAGGYFFIIIIAGILLYKWLGKK